MAEIINLRMARKAKARSTRESTAAANRALHGESKLAQAARKAEQARTDSLLDGAKREQE